jgi:hypothetical protein
VRQGAKLFTTKGTKVHEGGASNLRSMAYFGIYAFRGLTFLLAATTQNSSIAQTIPGAASLEQFALENRRPHFIRVAASTNCNRSRTGTRGSGIRS